MAKWASVTLKTGPIAAEHANEQLRIEIIQAGSGQVLIDNVKLDAINTYDDEAADAHYIAGDGRVNEKSASRPCMPSSTLSTTAWSTRPRKRCWHPTTWPS